MEETFLFIIEVIGTFAFAISGIRLAAYKSFDWFGAYVVGLVTAIGGGTLRDLLLDIPVFWMQTWMYLGVTGISLAIVIIFRRLLVSNDRMLFIFDTLGIAFGPYRAQYDRITDPARMRYWENYNASEGFFGVQHRPGHPAMELLMNTETYYELIPESEWTEATPQAIPVWEAREGEIYELVVTSSNGLWRYRLGDTVRVESTEPLTVTIAGRTRHFINAFGEEVMVYNTDAALVSACRATGTEVLNYTVAPVYAGDRTRGRHQWLVEFGRRPADMQQFADILDRALQAENSDYQAKRSGDIFLSRLEITEAVPGLFDRWLASTGKLGGQRKVPRLSNDRSFIDPMLALNTASRSQNVTDHKSGS